MQDLQGNTLAGSVNHGVRIRLLIIDNYQCEDQVKLLTCRLENKAPPCQATGISFIYQSASDRAGP